MYSAWHVASLTCTVFKMFIFVEILLNKLQQTLLQSSTFSLFVYFSLCRGQIHQTVDQCATLNHASVGTQCGDIRLVQIYFFSLVKAFSFFKWSFYLHFTLCIYLLKCYLKALHTLNSALQAAFWFGFINIVHISTIRTATSAHVMKRMSC